MILRDMVMQARVRLARAAERHRLNEQEGAYLLEFLGTLVALLGFLLLVVQVVMIFMNAILVNHALGLAAQEAAARGGIDDNVRAQFDRHLPRNVRSSGAESVTCLPASCNISGNITPGVEPTQSGETITLEYNYVQRFDLLKLIGISSAGVEIHRSAKVASQSSKE
jgi:Flp pilus assembly protein TadG